MAINHQSTYYLSQTYKA